MPVRLFTNNASAMLAAPISDSDTTITLVSGQGALFASPSGGNWQDVTLDDGTNIEIVRMTARSGDTLTVTRAQEGTTAVAFAAGAKIEGRWTAGAAMASASPALQFQDEGANLGASGGVDTINFTGAGVTATKSGSTLTVNVPNSGGPGVTRGQVVDILGIPTML